MPYERFTRVQMTFRYSEVFGIVKLASHFMFPYYFTISGKNYVQETFPNIEGIETENGSDLDEISRLIMEIFSMKIVLFFGRTMHEN